MSPIDRLEAVEPAGHQSNEAFGTAAAMEASSTSSFSAQRLHSDVGQREEGFPRRARVDEVKDIRDKAVAMQHCARQAKDSQLIEQATDIRLRAERRAGQLLKEMGDAGERARGGGDLRKELQPATLSDLGVTRTQSSRWQKLADLPDDKFEQRTVAAKKQAVSSVEANCGKARTTGRARSGARGQAVSPSGQEILRHPCRPGMAARAFARRRRNRTSDVFPSC
jgi:hypothetical protein